MQPRIERRAAFHVVGIEERYIQGKQFGIPAQWEHFANRDAELVNAVPGVSYGISIPDPRPGEATFVYLVCREVRAPAAPPAGMVALTIPAQTYAVFTHRGSIRDFHLTLRAIWREWLPASGLTVTHGPELEIYDHRFKMEAPDSEVDVCVPVVAPTA